jgi:antitoxin component HigA of HigAB toxin-antitoxin module
MILAVETQTQYDQAMSVIETFLAKKSANLTETDLAELQRISLLAERYEKEHYPMPIVLSQSTVPNATLPFWF